MTPMIDFSIALQGAVADFLAAEPVIYLFATILFCFVCKAFKSLAR